MSLSSSSSRGAYDNHHHWKQVVTALIAMLGISAIVVGGGVLGYVMGPPKTFVSILAVMAIWAIAGWFLGGWRAVMTGLATLTAALSASNGDYPLAVALAALSLLFLLFTHLDILPSRH